MLPRLIRPLALLLLPCFAVVVAPVSAADSTTLKNAAAPHFLIGAAVAPRNYADPDSADARLLKSQFKVLTAENAMKWSSLQPAPGRYDFREADRLVDFARANDLYVIGHTLVWHEQTPKWVFEGPAGRALTRDELLSRMREHIEAVVGRYRGRVQAWDVVNEAIDDRGALRDSPWRRIIGDDFVEKAFEYARAADPEAHLYYNDYRLEHPPKREGALALLKKLQAADVRIDGVGLQGHVNLTGPTIEAIDATIDAFARLGLQVMITELDVDVLPGLRDWGDADVRRREIGNPAFDPYKQGLPPEIQEKLALRYADLFRVYLKHSASISRVTFWGLNDGDSWLNDWPIPGRTSHPLLFDRDNQPKPAYHAVIEILRSAPAPAPRALNFKR